jgi:hypothetical protein
MQKGEPIAYNSNVWEAKVSPLHIDVAASLDLC